MELAEKTVHTRHSGGAIHIIIPEDQYFFCSGHSSLNTIHGFFHILHQPGGMEV